MTAAPMTVRICHLYPRLLSVAGDRGNLLTLLQRCAWREIRCIVTEADAGVVPDFARSDLVLLHGGQDREMTAAARDGGTVTVIGTVAVLGAVVAAKAGALRDAIEAGAVVLAVCAGYQLLGRY
jgi:lipid II isoglutaminyl synthase (glutamine-hydrolysing)